MTRILIIDDNQAVLNFLRIFLLQTGKFQVEILQDSTEAYETIENKQFDILLLDMDMPNVSGLDILKYLYEHKIKLTTIVLTGVEDIDLAVQSMKLGTFDYLLKPIEEDKLLETLENAKQKFDYTREETTVSTEKEVTTEGLKFPEAFEKIITKNEEMLKIFHYVEKFASTDNSVLIWGESGVGKELIARAIHKISIRRDKKFIAVNAGAFAQELFSSEFFGYEKGAFTGASKQKTGFIEEANGGTLFLDEIGELSLPIQIKLLRVLQEGEFYRLGSTKNIKVNVRIIAATNKNLFDEIQKGKFRKDLFFRLNINSIRIPALRERNDDIEVLSNYFFEKYKDRYDKKIDKISASTLRCLKSYPFPGNIRELMNIINSAIIVEPSNELKRSSLPHYFLENTKHSSEIMDGYAPKKMWEIEKEHIQKVLKYTDNNRTKAADILGISRVNLIAKIKKYELV
jgi:DNA-binding NtrC family response regulator